MLIIEKQVMVFKSIEVKRVDDNQVFDHSVTIVEQEVVTFNGTPIAYTMPELSREASSYIEVD